MFHFSHAFKTKLQDLKRDQERIWYTLAEMSPEPSGDPEDDRLFNAFEETLHYTEFAVENFESLLEAAGAGMVFYAPDANEDTVKADSSSEPNGCEIQAAMSIHNKTAMEEQTSS